MNGVACGANDESIIHSVTPASLTKLLAAPCPLALIGLLEVGVDDLVNPGAFALIGGRRLRLMDLFTKLHRCGTQHLAFGLDLVDVVAFHGTLQ